MTTQHKQRCKIYYIVCDLLQVFFCIPLPTVLYSMKNNFVNIARCTLKSIVPVCRVYNLPIYYINIVLYIMYTLYTLNYDRLIT